MNKKLTNIEFISLMYFLIISLYNNISNYNIIQLSEIDCYFSILLTYPLGIIIFLLLKPIFNYKPNNNILEKNKYLFGPLLGNIFNIIINIILLLIGIILLCNITNFIITQFLNQTPTLIFLIILSILLIYNVSKGLKNIAKVSIIFLAINITLTLLNIIGIFPHFQPSNLKPFLEHGEKRIILSSIQLTLTNIIPLFLLLIIKKNDIQNNKNITKPLLISYTCTFLIILTETLLTIGTLGIYLTKLYQYPEYIVIQRITIFHFIDRVENIIYMKQILSSIICLSLIIYHNSKILNTTNQKISLIPITLIIIITTIIIFKTNTYLYISYNILPIICLLLFIIYIIITINILIRKKKHQPLKY